MTEKRSPVDISNDIAELIRELNYATMPVAPELEYPGDLYSVIANLKLAAIRLPQAFGQMAKWLSEQDKAGLVAHDTGRDASQCVRAVVVALTEAAQESVTLRAALDNAHNACSGLKASEGDLRPEREIGEIGL